MNRRRFLKNASRYLGALGFAGPLSRTGPWTQAADAQTMSGLPSQIFLNQLGYLPSHAKVATVAERASTFTVQSTVDSSVVFHGSLSQPRPDAASGDLIQQADFSGLTTPGRYWLALDTGSISDPFRIGPDVYKQALYMTMRAFYGQRCGCNVDLGGGYAHPPCHLDAAYHASSGKKGVLKNHGGWHDAGDYGRYIVNSGISTGTLLWTWEFFEPTVRSLNLNIPESGGKIPDFLAEIQWNLEWMLTLQDKDGGVWQKQTSEQFCGFIMPQDDHAISYVIGTGYAPYKSTCATADFCAVMAIAARCYNTCAPQFAQRCLQAARKAWLWCQKYPNVLFDNPRGVNTGSYADTGCSDELLWAAAELWRTTGEPAFQNSFLAAYTNGSRGALLEVIAPSWSGVSALAYWSYALSMEKSPDTAAIAIRQSTAGTAHWLQSLSANNGYGNTLSMSDYVWGSNGVAANHSLLLIVANHFQPDAAMLDCALNNLHYLLGRNCLGISWVTQLGARPFQHPHHRPSIAGMVSAPWPGLLSGGPNARPADSVADTLPNKPPMRMYIDDHLAYSVNEVAINWNAPLVFLLAAANSLQ